MIQTSRTGRQKEKCANASALGGQFSTSHAGKKKADRIMTQSMTDSFFMPLDFFLYLVVVSFLRVARHELADESRQKSWVP